MSKPVDGQMHGCLKKMDGLMDGKITSDDTPCCGWLDIQELNIKYYKKSLLTGLWIFSSALIAV